MPPPAERDHARSGVTAPTTAAASLATPAPAGKVADK